MPELPEVETVMRGLTPALLGRQIVGADVRRAGLRYPFPEDMAGRLRGVRVIHLHRRGKYILCDLDSGQSLLIHLGMSGSVLVSAGPGDLGKHDHVVLDLDNGGRVIFNDPRRFGALDLIQTDKADLHRLLVGMGVEPLGNHFNDAYLAGAFAGRAVPIKTALLDQRIIAGLGNIYVCEALWHAQISPIRAAGRIGRPRLSRLCVAIRDVLERAIVAGGSSLKDHRQTSGDWGHFQHHFNAYGREGEECLANHGQAIGANQSGANRCSGVIRRIVQSNRSTFYCPKCQK